MSSILLYTESVYVSVSPARIALLSETKKVEICENSIGSSLPKASIVLREKGGFNFSPLAGDKQLIKS